MPHLNQEQVKSLINNLDLSMVARNMVIKHGWLKSEVEEAEKLYRNFLFLQFKYPDEKLPPSEDIDEFWHNHILDTARYRRDCEHIFGHYLDHYPYFGIDGKSNQDDLDKAFNRTQELHQQEFGFLITGVRYTSLSRLFRKFFKL